VTAVYRRRRLVALAVLAATVALLAWGANALLSEKAAVSGGAPAAAPPGPPQLPRGGRAIFPAFRVVAYYGNPQARGLGALGIGPPSKMAVRLLRQAHGYARKTRPVLPALELISTVATGAPGADGLYRLHAPDAVIARYLRAARRVKGLLVLDIQPGRGDFVSEVQRLRRWLVQPDVGLALDPEWHVGSTELPGRTIGSVDAAEVNAVSAYLADIVRRGNLPQKLFLVHQFTNDMIRNKASVLRRPGLATTINVDGFGDRPNKLVKYRAFTAERPRFRNGLKLFYEEDTNLLTPGAVMDLHPRPDVVVYE
jgi:hypothetical protein